MLATMPARVPTDEDVKSRVASVSPVPTASSDANFPCDICGKTFTRSFTLRTHKRVHTGEKPFQCDTCGKSFTRSFTLRRHERVHTGEKPYACSYCPQRFSQSSHLTRHERVHTGERPYHCRFCNKSFSVSYALSRHERVHRDQEEFIFEQPRGRTNSISPNPGDDSDVHHSIRIRAQRPSRRSSRRTSQGLSPDIVSALDDSDVDEFDAQPPQQSQPPVEQVQSQQVPQVPNSPVYSNPPSPEAVLASARHLPEPCDVPSVATSEQVMTTFMLKQANEPFFVPSAARLDAVHPEVNFEDGPEAFNALLHVIGNQIRIPVSVTGSFDEPRCWNTPTSQFAGVDSLLSH